MSRPRTIPDPSEELRDVLCLVVRVTGCLREAGRRFDVPRNHLEAWMRRDPDFRSEIHAAKDSWQIGTVRLVARFILDGASTQAATARAGVSREWLQDQIRHHGELRRIIQRAREGRDDRERVRSDQVGHAG